MKKIKILYVITSLGLGGAENLLLSYIKRLDDKKYTFYVCCLRDKPNDLLSQISNYANVINLNISNRFNPIVIIYLKKIIQQIQPDIIHTHLFQPRFYVTIAHLFNRRARLITHKHNNVNLRKHNIFIILEMFSILMNNKVIAISQSVKKSLMRFEFVPEKKICVIPNGIDYQKFNKFSNTNRISDKKQIIIGTVCRLERQKGLIYLLLAMKIILAKFPHTILEIVGDGSLLAKLKDFSRKLGISNSVIFFGKFTDVKPFYDRMDIFALPSLYEGFGIVLLEAMASGVPVIATDVDGIKEVVSNDESGILVPPKNPEALANAIVRIIEDTELRKKMIAEGLIRAKLFDIQEHIMKLDNLYNSLLGAESPQ